MFQFLCAAPIHAFPNELLYQLSAVSLGQGTNHAVCWNRTAQLRVAYACSIDDHVSNIGHEFSIDDEERFLAHPMSAWVGNSLSLGIFRNKLNVLCVHGIDVLAGRPQMHRQIYNILLGQLRLRTPGQALSKRICYWLKEVEEGFSEYIQKTLHCVCCKLKKRTK